MLRHAGRSTPNLRTYSTASSGSTPNLLASPPSGNDSQSFLTAAGLDQGLPPLPNFLPPPKRLWRNRQGSETSTAGSDTGSVISTSSSRNSRSGQRKRFVCKACQALISYPESVLSEKFSGYRGKASLFNNVDVFNVAMAPPSVQLMYTGAYTISETTCRSCQAYLGWKIVRAHEWSEKWKEGDFLFEMEALGLEEGEDPLRISDVEAASISGESAKLRRRSTRKRSMASPLNRLSQFVRGNP